MVKKLNTRHIEVAKKLRKNPTEIEKLLWRKLRAKQVEGFRFRRQQPIGDFVVDFVCLERKLVIEVDGGQHALEDENSSDKRRDKWLSEEGYKVLRFWNNEVLTNIEGVLEVIRESLVNR